MLTNYLTVAVRSLLRRKGYSFINIAGLSLGLTCCLLIFQYVAHEYSFDAFHVNARNLYRVTETGSRDKQMESLEGYALGPTLAAEIPEIVQYARLHPDYNEPVISIVEQPEKVFEERRVYYVDPAFLQMFSFPLVRGNASNSLEESGTVLMSESSASKYFGPEDPIGKTLNVTGWINGIFRVTGIFRDVPVNSHLQFDFLLPMADLLQRSNYKDPAQAWHWSNFMTYVQLRPDANIGKVEQKFTDVVMKHRKGDFERTKTSVRVNAQPLDDVHLNDGVFAPRAITGSYRSLYFFTLVGIITVLIALINYVNLATARSLDRAREVGIRKVVGAHRKQLVFQFLTESALTNIGALILAIVLSEVLRPIVNRLAGTSLTGGLWTGPRFWAAFLTTFCASTLLAGLYPAFVLSSFKPASVLKGKSGATSLRLRLRQGLVILQFTASIVLLAGTAIVYSQLHFMRHMDLGITLEQILTVPGPRVISTNTNNIAAMNTLKQELRRIPAIGQMATASALPGEGFNWYTSGLRQTSADPSTAVRGALARVDTAFASLFELTLVAGRGFEGMTAPLVEVQLLPVIANETAIHAIGFATADESLNQLVNMGRAQCRIIGVFKDFSWSSAHSKRESALFALTPSGGKLALKVNTADLAQTIASIRRVYTALFPGNPFEYHFVDERFDEQYRSDERFATLFGVFATLAILIACLGLFGLAAFTAEQRTKEMGVRKVLGASVSSLVALLTRESLLLVLIANLLAWPFAFFIMNKWLETFAYRIDIGMSVFLVAGILALLIALATVSTQAIRAARANPVEALRNE
jgi:putative ABC transport system permease protein